jgi:hypothetical protein
LAACLAMISSLFAMTCRSSSTGFFVSGFIGKFYSKGIWMGIPLRTIFRDSCTPAAGVPARSRCHRGAWLADRP